MVVQTPEHRAMDIQHYTEITKPTRQQQYIPKHINTMSYSPQISQEEYDDRYYISGARQRNGVSQGYPRNDSRMGAEGESATQVYYINAPGNRHSDRESNNTLSKMTTQLWTSYDAGRKLSILVI